MIRSVFITGGSGFLGYGLVCRLLKDGVERICVYSRGEHRQAEMRNKLGNPEQLRWVIGDVRDGVRLARSMRGCDVVIHAAALKRIEVGAYNPGEVVRTNVNGTENLIEAARSVQAEKVVLVSSDKAFEPISPYGYTKALAEVLFLSANTVYDPMFSVCRYGNVAGSTGSVIPAWRAGGNSASYMTDPESTRFWMTLDEAVEFVLSTVLLMKGGELRIPELPAFRLQDLATAMGICPKVIGLQKFEKLHESMAPGVSSDRARRMGVMELRDCLKKIT